METVLGILGFAALFVAFGLFRPVANRGCGGDCGGACPADGSGCEAGLPLTAATRPDGKEA